MRTSQSESLLTLIHIQLIEFSFETMAVCYNSFSAYASVYSFFVQYFRELIKTNREGRFQPSTLTYELPH